MLDAFVWFLFFICVTVSLFFGVQFRNAVFSEKKFPKDKYYYNILKYFLGCLFFTKFAIELSKFINF